MPPTLMDFFQVSFGRCLSWPAGPGSRGDFGVGDW